MLKVALIFVLAAHLMAANFATAGPFFCLWLQRRQMPLAVGLASWSMGSLGAAMVLGLAAVGLLAIGYPGPLAAGFGSVPESRLWFGVVELVFYFACLAGYLAVARRSSDASRGRRWTLVVLALLAGTDLAYHFPPLFAVIGIHTLRPESAAPPSFLAAMLEPEALALALHFLLASAVVGGIVVAWLAAERGVVRVAGRVALAATVCQFASGAWLLFAISHKSRDALLGDNLLGTLLFGAAVVGSVLLLHKLAEIACGDGERRETGIAAAWLAAVIVSMTAAQQVVRFAVLDLRASQKTMVQRPLFAELP
ncbi:MAG TPA: hypothetical protein VHZ24_08145 [Pirellulales bacterium]|nr:hypothetical protein [Pirellulales bacterium]